MTSIIGLVAACVLIIIAFVLWATYANRPEDVNEDTGDYD